MSIRYMSRLSVTGSLWPSSRHLARAVADVASRERGQPDELVFAGIGNGVIAQRFLHWPCKATFVDVERSFCDRFETAVRYGDHRVVCSDVADFLAGADGSRGRLVVSCVPLLGPFFSRRVVEAMIAEVIRGGRVVFYSYSPRIRGSRLADCLNVSNVTVRRERSVMWNLPPAYVYSLTLRSPD